VSANFEVPDVHGSFDEPAQVGRQLVVGVARPQHEQNLMLGGKRHGQPACILREMQSQQSDPHDGFRPSRSFVAFIASVRAIGLPAQARSPIGRNYRPARIERHVAAATCLGPLGLWARSLPPTALARLRAFTAV
jgi:hypothetical protein